MKKKWFYAIQEKVQKYLSENYAGHECNYQDVLAWRVYENYICIRKSDGHPVIVQVVMQNRNNSYFIYESVASGAIKQKVKCAL